MKITKAPLMRDALNQALHISARPGMGVGAFHEPVLGPIPPFSYILYKTFSPFPIHRLFFSFDIPGMEPLLVVFPCECGVSLKVDDDLAGRLVRCPSCRRTARVPTGGLLSTPRAVDCSAHFITEPTPTTGGQRSSFILEETLAPPDRQWTPIREMAAFLAPAQQDDELGRMGNYRILSVLGQGGMGVVFEAEDVQLRRKVAIKAMLPHLAANNAARERFLREACLAAGLEHDHIVAIHHIGEERGVPYLVMPLLRGESLDRRIKTGQALAPSLILQVGLEVADALAAAHSQGLLHRDIKPANVWLEDRGDGEARREESGVRRQEEDRHAISPRSSLLDPHSSYIRVKLLDFGLARLTVVGAQEPLTLSGAVLGTPGYMAPEQVDGAELDGRSDLFSLGCILYSLATGQAAFPGESLSARLKSVILSEPIPPQKLSPEIPRELSTLILQMLAKQKEDRPASAAEVVARLRQIQLHSGFSHGRGAPRHAAPGPYSWPAPPTPRRRRFLALAAVLATVFVAVGAALLWPRPNRDIVHRSAMGPQDTKDAGWMGWPPEAPPPAVAPFDAGQAELYQATWAKYLGVPVEWTNTFGMKFRLMPPGEFSMGTPRAEIDEAVTLTPNSPAWHVHFRAEGPQHRVVLTKPFYLGVYEVTQKEFQGVTGSNPSSFSATGRRKDAVVGQDTKRHPVDSVDWLESVAFTNKLGEREKLKPRYFRAGGTVTLLQGNGYRLPTEAEWEFACRAGTATRYWFGDKDLELNQAAWFRENSGDLTHAVGELKENAFGLFDMYGNVWEWCQDWFDAEYYQSLPNPAVDPLGPAGGSDRVLRGGGWTVLAPYCRSGARHPSVPFSNGLEPGFRVVIAVDTVRASVDRAEMNSRK